VSEQHGHLWRRGFSPACDSWRRGFSPAGITRRDLLKGLPGAALLGAAACRQSSPPPYDPARFTHAATSDVAVLPANRYELDFSDVIGRGLQLLNVDVRNKRVLLKPNLVEFERDRAINTHPAVIAGAAQALLRAGARQVVVAEGPGHRRDIDYLVTGTGLLEHVRNMRVPFVDLNHDDVRRVSLASRFMALPELALPVALLEADLVVSMPKLKTHHWMGMTCSLKNLFGVVPGAVYGWPKNILHFRGIENAILDLAATVRPGLSIVDAVVGMEGDGPIMGTAKPVGCLVLGRDPVAVDATCARIMGLRPETLPYLERASAFLGNLAEERVLQRGEPLTRFATSFDVLPSFRLSMKGTSG
jgi:uncharacterized protein (DUF362 family)